MADVAVGSLDDDGENDLDIIHQRKEVNVMPGRDRTGPRGMGPMTGRGLGYCAGADAPGYVNPAPGYGRGLGRGRGWWRAGRGWGGGGRGWRHWYFATGLPGWARFDYPPAWGYGPYQPMTQEQETELLKNQAEALKRELDAIAQRLEELEKGE